jgi:hypothetical protein
MRPEQLAARSAAKGQMTDRTVLATLCAADELGLTPGQVVGRTGLSPRAVRYSLARQERLGLVGRQGKRRVWATNAGRSQAGASLPALNFPAALKTAIGKFPSQAQQAWVRLGLSAIVARHHLGRCYPDGWAGFIGLGRTNTGKTATAEFICKVLDVKREEAIRNVGHETPGSIFVRRRQTSEGWIVEPAAHLRLPFLCLDEWDKGSPEVKREAAKLLLGDTSIELEDKRLEVRPTVMLCFNAGAEGLSAVRKDLPEAYIRRAVPLNTWPLTGLLENLGEAMRHLFEGPIPTISLDGLRPAEKLPEPLIQLLQEELKVGLTPEGWSLCDVRSLSRLVLGRAALKGDTDLRGATLETAFDYLTCKTTVAHTVSTFDARLYPHLRGEAALRPNVSVARAERKRQEQLERKAKSAELRKGESFKQDRDRKAALLVAAKEELGRPRDVEGKVLGTALSRAAKHIRSRRRKDAVDAAWDDLGQPLLQRVKARQLAAAADADRYRRQSAAEAKATLIADANARRRSAEREILDMTCKALTQLRHSKMSDLELMKQLESLGLVEDVSQVDPPGTVRGPHTPRLRAWRTTGRSPRTLWASQAREVIEEALDAAVENLIRLKLGAEAPRFSVVA